MSTRMVFHIPKASKESLCSVMTTELEIVNRLKLKRKLNVLDFPSSTHGSELQIRGVLED